MKTAKDPRHQKRIQLMKALFEFDFHPKKKPKPELSPTLKHLKKIDAIILKSAPLWPKKQINRIDLSILRLSVFELLFKETPKKVVIDEAVELAKEYGSESSPNFINGVLGKILNG